MKQAWVVLTKRYGEDVHSPTDKQLIDALNEVYAGAASKSDHHDIGSATLRFGYDDGLMYVIEISCDHSLTFEEWSDQDCEVELSPPRKMTEVPKSLALELWQCLIHRQIAKIRAQSWTMMV